MAFTCFAPRKRALSSQDDDIPETKRRRTSLSAVQPAQEFTPTGASIPILTADAAAKEGLRRSIALVLDKVGFDTADEDAMESFAHMVETYLLSLAQDVKAFANASRRSYPIPTDFESSLARFNLSMSSLKPHLRPPVRRSKREPTWATPAAAQIEAVLSLPILGNDLSGTPDKEAKKYIPNSFPPFPSLHTYKYTPENAESVTVSTDWGSFEPDVPSQTVSQGSSQAKTQTQTRPLAPDEIPRGDPKKMREAAAKEAKAGEEALRRLVRASKIAKQKEVWMTAQREPARRERYDLWESAMRELIEDDARARGKSFAPGATHGAMGRFEIADHSMIVNAEGKYQRKEVPRAGGRKVGAGEMGLGKGKG